MKRLLAAGVGLILVVAALLLALEGTLSRTSRRDTAVARVAASTRAARRARTGTTGASSRTAPDARALSTAADAPTGPGEMRLRRALGRALASAGPNVGALVLDLSTGTTLYFEHPDVVRPPASVEKLWTTTALLDRLGPDARLHTAILGTGRERDGVWHGDLYLRGGGDPTFGDTGFNRIWNHGEGSTPGVLVGQLRRLGIRRVTGHLYADESLFDRRRGGLITDYKPDVPDFGGQLSALTYDHGTTLAHDTPATFAAHEVALTLRASRIEVTASPRSRRTPRTAQLLATVASPPMTAMVRLMNVPSDDLFAELFCKQLGVLFGSGGSISAGARVIASTIAAHYDLHPRILDGSGLGRADRSSPLQIVELLRDVWHTPVGDELTASLPEAAVNGTMEGIGAHTPAARRCLAKTGSLDFVSNLAGYCTARDGHTLAFGLFLDGPDNGTGFALESRMVGAIAGY